MLKEFASFDSLKESVSSYVLAGDALGLAKAKFYKSEMKNDYRQILIDFFDKHDPPRLATIDALLDKHEGKEEELLDGLIEKYAD